MLQESEICHQSCSKSNLSSSRADLVVQHVALRFSINSDRNTGVAGSTIYGVSHDSKIINIFVNASLIWPLLESRFTESEKAGYYLALANVIMHELAVSELFFAQASLC